MSAFEKWQVAIQVLQTGILFMTLLVALYIGFRQTEISAEQNEISSKQADIATKQLDDSRHAEDVQYRSDLASLRKATLAIIDLYPSTGFRSMEAWTPEQRIQFLSSLRALIDAECTNLALVRNKEHFDAWLDASTEARLASQLPLDSPKDAEMFVKIVSRVNKRIYGIAWADQFIRNTSAPKEIEDVPKPEQLGGEKSK